MGGVGGAGAADRAGLLEYKLGSMGDVEDNMNDDDTPSARYIVAVFALATPIVLLAVGAMV